jgi:hypothetical protein
MPPCFVGKKTGPIYSVFNNALKGDSMSKDTKEIIALVIAGLLITLAPEVLEALGLAAAVAA